MGEDGNSTLCVSLDVSSSKKTCSDIQLFLRPLLATGEREIGLATRHSVQDVSFPALKSEQVSAFFVLRGIGVDGCIRECVTVCPHDKFDDAELSLESRSRKLIGSIVSGSGAALARYIAHAFDLPEAAYGVDESGENADARSFKGYPAVPSGLYERLLDMADANPKVFERARFLMDLIPNEVHHKEIDELRKLVETFAKAVR